jgi:hypothetical protein
MRNDEYGFNGAGADAKGLIPHSAFLIHHFDDFQILSKKQRGQARRDWR